MPAALPTALVVLLAALPATLVALSAASLTAVVAGFRELCEFRAFGELRAFRDLLALLDEPRERAWDFFEPPERFAEVFDLA